MSRSVLLLICVSCNLMVPDGGLAESQKKKSAADVPPALQFTVDSLAGKPVALSDYEGKVILIVNVASQCGLTPQYEQLQQLHEKYADQGLAILAFPCNQFGAQEPGSPDEIRDFCDSHFGVKFDLFAKVDVNGAQACPLYQYLTGLKTEPKGAGKIDWNFEKFLIGRSGDVVGRFAPKTKPDDPEIIKLIDGELAKKNDE